MEISFGVVSLPLTHNPSFTYTRSIVNIDRVDESLLHENMLAEIKTKSGHHVPVSRRHLKTLRERLNF